MVPPIRAIHAPYRDNCSPRAGDTWDFQCKSSDFSLLVSVEFTDTMRLVSSLRVLDYMESLTSLSKTSEEDLSVQRSLGERFLQIMR